MFKMMLILFVGACMYIMWGEAKKVFVKKRMEDVLEDHQTESDVLDMEEEAMRLERENKERKEALYNKETEV